MPRLPQPHPARRPLLLPLLLPLLALLAQHARPVAAEPACPTVLPNPPDPRIVGGLPAPPQLAVFLAALFNQRSRFRCSATILAPGWLLTARHCNVSAEWTAVLSTADRNIGTPQTIAEVIPHPTPGERFDLTLVRLAVTPGPLPVPPLLLNADPSAPRVASFARTAGYGRRDYDDPRNTRLRQVDVPIVDPPACEAAYGASIVDERLCAGYAAGGCDSCTGDSGGPLLQYDAQLRPVLLAGVSAGKNCALPGFPGLYAPIYPVLGWLREHGIEFDTGNPSDSATAATDLDAVVETPSPSPSPFPSSSPISSESTSADVVTSGSNPTSASASPATIPSAGADDASVAALPPSGSTISGTGDGVNVSGGEDGGGDAIVSGSQDGSASGDTAEGSADVAVTEQDESSVPAVAPALPAATASPTAGASEAARQNGSGGLSGGSVAGIAVAGVAVGVVLVVASVCYVMMPRRTDAAVAV